MRLALAAIFLFLTLAGARAGYNEGVAAYERGAYKTAFKEFLPLARNGDAFAQSYLGVMYQYGLGVAADLEKAVEWYGRAAENGDAMAQRIIGDLYADGAMGKPDYAMAAKWYEFAAQNGDSEAQRKLGLLYLKGRGVATDRDAAAKWLHSAERSDDAEARRVLRETRVDRARAPSDAGTNTAILKVPDLCKGDPDAPYEIDVRIVFPEAVIDHSHSIAQLGKISGLGHNKRALGLMKPDLRIETWPKAQGLAAGRKFCFWISGFEVVLRYRRVDVYVAREYARGSCNYNAILSHEHKHVDAARLNLQEFAPKIRMALTSMLIPTGREPALVNSRAEARKDVGKISDELLKPVYEEMIRSLMEAQARIDSPEEYRRVRNMCPTW